MKLLFSLILVIHLGVYYGVYSQDECRMDIAFVIDSSVSIPRQDFVKQIQFVNDFVNMLKIGPFTTRVAAVSFSNETHPQFGFSEHNTKAEVLAAINNIKHVFGDSTRTYKALEYTHKTIFAPGRGERPEAIDVVVVLTDGATNPGSYDEHSGSSAKRQTQLEAATIKERPAYVFAIGIGSGVDVAELNGISSDPDSFFTILVDDFDNLNSDYIKQTFFVRTCLEINNPRPQTTPRITPRPPTAAPSTRCRLDLAFVIDSSVSIRLKDYKKQLKFVTDIVNLLEIGQDYTKVAAIAFSHYLHPQFGFNEYITKEAVVEAIKNMEYYHGVATRTYLALDYARTTLFSPGEGERPDATDVVIVLTDGVTNPGSSYDQHSGNSAKRQTQIEAYGIKSRPAYVFAIGVGNQIDMNEINGIASDPDSLFAIELEKFNELRNRELLTSIVETACQGTPLPPPPTSRTVEAGPESIRYPRWTRRNTRSRRFKRHKNRHRQ